MSDDDDINQLESLNDGDLIVKLVDCATKLSDKQKIKEFNESISSISMSKKELSELINANNDLITNLDNFTSKIRSLEEFKTQKLYDIKEFNLLVKNIKKLDIKNTKIDIQYGAGLISDYYFKKEYQNYDFEDKLNKLDELQRNIEEINTKLYTNKIKESFVKVIKSINTFKKKINDIKGKIDTKSKIFTNKDNYFNTLHKYLKIINILNDRKKSPKISNISGNGSFIIFTSDLEEKLNKIESNNKTKDTVGSAISKSGENSVNNKSTLMENYRLKQEKTELTATIENLKKSVQQYKQLLKSRKGGVVPTLSSAVRFSKTNQLLGIPTNLVSSLSTKKQSKDMSGPSVRLQSRTQYGVQLSDTDLEELNNGSLFSTEFITFLKKNKELKVLNFLAVFNKEKTRNFNSRNTTTQNMTKFCNDFLNKLKILTKQEQMSILYSKILLKDVISDDLEAIINLIINFVNYDTTAFNSNTNPDIRIIYNLLEEKLKPDTMTLINSGTLFSSKQETKVQSAQTGLSDAAADKIDQIKKIVIDAFSNLSSDKFTDAVKKNATDSYNLFNKFFTKLAQINSIIDSEKTLGQIFNKIDQNKIKATSGGIYNASATPIPGVNLPTFFSKLLTDTADEAIISLFFNEILLKKKDDKYKLNPADITTYNWRLKPTLKFLQTNKPIASSPASVATTAPVATS